MTEDDLKLQRMRDFNFSDFILRAEAEENGDRLCIVPDYQPTARKVKRTRKSKKSLKAAARSSNDESNNNNLVA